MHNNENHPFQMKSLHVSLFMRPITGLMGFLMKMWTEIPWLHVQIRYCLTVLTSLLCPLFGTFMMMTAKTLAVSCLHLLIEFVPHRSSTRF